MPTKAQTDFAFFEKLTYVDYQEDQSVLSMWMKHHTSVKSPDLDVRVYITDAQAISKMFLRGVSLGVLPGHLVQKLSDEGQDIQVMKGSGVPLINHISVAFLEEKTLTPSAKQALEFLKAQLLKK